MLYVIYNAFQLHESSLSRLSPGGWYNDEIVNVCAFVQKDIVNCQNVQVLDSYFLPHKVCTHSPFDQTKLITIRCVKTKSRPVGQCFFSDGIECVVFPINHENVHWQLVTAIYKLPTIYLITLDSLEESFQLR